MTLAERWEELAKTHKPYYSDTNDSWPKVTIWFKFKSGCSCGAEYPTVDATEGEIRHSGHLSSYVQSRRDFYHLKHLVSVLLAEDWLPWDEVNENYVEIEQA